MALGATTTAMVPAQETPDRPWRQVGRLDPGTLPSVPTQVETSPAPLTAEEHCTPTRPGSRERRGGAVTACVTTEAAPVPTDVRRGAAPAQRTTAAADGNTGSCEITNPGTYTYTRFSYCVTGLTVRYVLKDTQGKELGTGTLEVSTSATLPAKGTTWDENVSVTMTGATGAVTSLTAKFRPACGDGCKVTKTAPWYGGNLTVGKSASGAVSYSSEPGPGQVLKFITSYKLYVSSPDAQPTDPNAAWSNPREIRCDDAVRQTVTDPGSTPAPGCVIPSIMAVTEMSTKPYDEDAADSGQGAAAAGYWWAQHNLVDGWGLKKPMTRAKTGDADRRKRTCGTGASIPFIDMKEVFPEDTCDEFPFASTHEGGTDGGLCAEILPLWENGGWNIVELRNPTFDPSRPCIRAHVSGPENSSAGSKFRWGNEKQRILEAEEFMLNITT
jgi:hypothetical protein